MNYSTTTFEFPNAIVRVHRPELTPEERTRRMKAIYDASAALLKEIERKKTNEKDFKRCG